MRASDATNDGKATVIVITEERWLLGRDAAHNSVPTHDPMVDGLVGTAEDCQLLLAALRGDSKATHDPRVVGLVRATSGQISNVLPWHVAVALGQLGDVRTVEPLLALLAAGPPPVRSLAATALGLMHERRAVEALATLVRDRTADEAVRISAAVALGQIGDARGVAPLMDAFRGDEPVASQAASSLDRLGAPSFAPLVAALRAPEALLRLRAIKALSFRDDPGVVGPLAAVLSTDHDTAVVTAAAWALTWQRDPGMRALLDTLASTRPEVRRAVVRALRAVASPRLPQGAARTPSPAEVRDHLLPLLDDSDAEVRRLAATSLRFLGEWLPHALPSPLDPCAVVGTVDADHLQFFLRDSTFQEEVDDDSASEETYARGLAVDPRGSLRVFTASYDIVPVAIEVLDAPPHDAFQGWARVVEASMAVPSGEIEVADLFGETDDTLMLRVAVPAGFCHVRLYVGTGGQSPDEEGEDYYRFVVWPVSTLDAPPVLLHGTTMI